MKNLDIEKLERKNPYTIPEKFFSEMQENVLEKAIKKNQQAQPKILKLNFAWATAAAIALIAGFGAVFFNNDKNTDVNIETNVVKTNPEKTPEVVGINTPETSVVVEQPKAAESYETLRQDIIAVENAEAQPKIRTENASVKIIAKADKPASILKIGSTNIFDTEYLAKEEAEVEKVLASFSSEDVRQFTKNSEQDVYLDLYN